MRYRLIPRQASRKKRAVLILSLLIALVIGLMAAFLVVDRIMTDRIASQYGTELASGVQYCDLAEASIAYRRFGSDGPAMLLIHGFLGSSHDFSRIWTTLAETHQVIAVDLIGFGLSSKSAELDYSKKNMADLCSLLMAELGFSQYSVLGHSMGGEVALHMASQYPSLVDRLILLNSAGVTDIQQGFRPALPDWFIEGVFKNYLVQRLYFPMTVHERDAADRDTFNRFFFFNSQIPASTLAKMTRDNDSGSLQHQLGTIAQPVLLIWGAQDRIIPLQQGKLLDSLLPNSRLAVLEGCGHLTFLERPAETLAEITRFLNETAP